MRTRRWSIVLVTVAVTSLCGCAYGSQTVACPSWAGFPTPQAKYDGATLVVVATRASRDGTEEIFGVDAHAHEVEVAEVLKGSVDSDRVQITSMPDSCSGVAEYPEGDPLEMSDPLIVFASEQGGEWFTLTPSDGTLPMSREVVDALDR